MILKFRTTDPAMSKLYPTQDGDEARWREYLWAYYRLTEKVDREVGKVMDALEAGGHADNTAIVFISDHGEGLGLHHWTQKQAFVETSARIPFIVSIPGQTPGNSVNEEDLISTMDIFPTFCELGGAEIPESLPGESLAPLIRKESSDWRDHVVSENEFTFGSGTGLHGRMVRSARYKYSIFVEGENREWLVDMETDPSESTNLVNDPEHAEALHQHRKWMQEWATEVRDEKFPYVA